MAKVKISVTATKVVTGTTGNDVLTVPAGTQLVNGGGGTDTVQLGAYQYFKNYQIVRNTDGSISVTDTHGGSLTNTKMVGISTLQFTDGSYNVTTGQFTAGTAVSPPPVIQPVAIDPSKIVTGSAGNDTLTVPAGTQLVNGGGGTDTVALGAYQYYASYQIIRNTDGSISVTDAHGGSLTNTKMVGIATLQFTDGSYDVATGQFFAAAKTVTGSAGNDTLTVPAGTQLVNGGGGTDTVALGAYQYYASYQIIRNTDGSISVTDAHGGSLTNTKMVGIATLQFTDGSYNVATGQFTAGATAAPAPVVAPPPPVVQPPAIDPTKVVTGSAGNDTLTVPAGTQLVNGGGGTDKVVLGDYQYYASYQITRNTTDGSISVTDAHGGSLTNTKMVGIATLQFTDGSYDVATGQFTAGAAVAPAPVVAAPPPVVQPPAIDPTKVVTGSAGNDTLTIPAGTQLVNGGGGTDTVVLGDYQYYANYQVARNADGSISVTDVHGGSLTNANMVGIATLQFTDGRYDVAAGQFTSGTATAIPPVSGATPTVGGTGNLIAPAIATALQPNDIVAVQIENHGATSLQPRVITFGQTFAPGDVPGGSHLVATINGQQVALQMDVKTTNADGSVAVAVLSVQAPALAANASADIMLSRGNAAIGGAVLDPHGFVAAGYDAAVALTFHNPDGTSSVQHIDVGAALTQALAAGAAQTWLQGPVAAEIRISTPINGSLTAQFDIRANADGTFVTDVAILNDKIFSADSKTYNYDISITSHGQSLFSQAGVQQTPMQDWERAVWSTAQGAGNAPADHLVYDVAYLEKTGAIARYETSTGLSAHELANETTALAGSNTTPLGHALVMQYEPTTGARPDIGPTTQWAADWLVSQSQTAEQIMLANAGAAAGIPIHAVNADGSLVTVTNHPNYWMDYRNIDPQTVGYSSIINQSGWTPDTAHMPDLAYPAALTTGSHFALDQLQAQANYDLLSMAPGYRADQSPLIGLQERGIAWTIRDLANAAYLTPDSDPLKGYFKQQLDGIIQNLLTHYVHGAAGQAEGALQGYVMGAWDSNQVAPWQQGYLMVALGQAAAQGFSGAAEILGWMDNFTSGLYLNGANGYNPLDGSGYWLTTGSGSVEPGGGFQSFTTWQQLFDANFAGQGTPTSLYGYPNDPIGGYSTIAKAALATAWDVTHSADDLAAYAYITQHTSFLIQDPNGYAASQTWDITPVLADGHHLQNSEVYYGNGGTTAAATPNGLLAAVSGDNLLKAGAGASILIGGDGKDTLQGGAGDDFLFAGTGVQTLYAGGGTNYIEGHLNGGIGPDLFQLSALDAAHDTIVNFKPGFDTLEITGGGQGMTALSLLAGAGVNAVGDAVLHLSAQHDVVLQGVHAAQIDTHSLHVI